MSSLAPLYTDEDMSAWVATLLQSRGLDVKAQRLEILVGALTADAITNQLLYA